MSVLLDKFVPLEQGMVTMCNKDVMNDHRRSRSLDVRKKRNSKGDERRDANGRRDLSNTRNDYTTNGKRDSSRRRDSGGRKGDPSIERRRDSSRGRKREISDGRKRNSSTSRRRDSSVKRGLSSGKRESSIGRGRREPSTPRRESVMTPTRAARGSITPTRVTSTRKRESSKVRADSPIMRESVMTPRAARGSITPTRVARGSITPIRGAITPKRESSSARADSPMHRRDPSMKRDSSTAVKRDSSLAAKRESLTGMKRDSSTGLKRDSSTGVKRDSSTGVKRDSSTGVKRDSSSAVRRDPSLPRRDTSLARKESASRRDSAPAIGRSAPAAKRDSRGVRRDSKPKESKPISSNGNNGPSNANGKSITKRCSPKQAAIRIQTMVRGAFRRMDYKIILLQRQLEEINDDDDDDMSVQNFELEKLKRIKEARDSWIHIAREALNINSYIKEKRGELRLGMVEFLSQKNTELQMEYKDYIDNSQSMKHNNKALHSKAATTTMHLRTQEKYNNKLEKSNKRLLQRVDEYKEMIRDTENLITKERLYHRVAYRKGKYIEDCIENILTLLEDFCTDPKLIHNIHAKVDKVKEYRKCKHMEHSIRSTSIFNLLEIQCDLMKSHNKTSDDDDYYASDYDDAGHERLTTL